MSVAHLPKRGQRVHAPQNLLNILVGGIVGVAIVGGFAGLLLCRMGVICTPADRVDLTAIHTQVRYKPHDSTDPKSLEPESTPQPIAEGDSIAVDAGGEATLRFSDRLIVRIFHDTTLSITGTVDPDAPPIYHYRLESGTTYNTLNPDSAANRRVRITTDWAVIEDLGTEFMAYVDPQTETTWVVVQKGEAQVTAQGRSIPVPAGMQTWVEPQQPPVAPIPARRDLIGDLFPQVDDLTRGAIADPELLDQGDLPPTDTPPPGAAPSTTATALLTETTTLPTDTPTLPIAVDQGEGLNVPVPQLSFRGVRTGGTIYDFGIDNWADFPAELFVAAPDLGQPPCDEGDPDRTTVELYDQDGTYIYSICRRRSPQDIAALWLDLNPSNPPPSAVYVVLHDWVANRSYPSNTVNISGPLPTLPAPTQLAPADGATLTDQARTTLQWSAVDSAASYVVEIDCDSCASTLVFPNITDTTYTIDPKALFGGPMITRWRVWAVDAAGDAGPQSGWWYITFVTTPTFTPTPSPTLSPTTGPLPAPTQLAPVEGARPIYEDRTTLQWSAVDGAASYAVEFECDGCQAAQVIPNLTDTTYTFTPSTLFKGSTTARWRVWAVDSASNAGMPSSWRDINYISSPSPTPTPTPPPPYVNLLSNESFELPPGEAATSWGFDPQGFAADGAWSDAAARTGAYGLSIAVSPPAQALWPRPIAADRLPIRAAIPSRYGSGWPRWAIGAAIPIESGQTYTFSAWASSPNQSCAWLEISMLDAQGTFLLGYSTGRVWLATANAWQQLTLTVSDQDPHAAGATHFMLELALCDADGSGSGTTVFYDDVFFGITP